MLCMQAKKQALKQTQSSLPRIQIQFTSALSPYCSYFKNRPRLGYYWVLNLRPLGSSSNCKALACNQQMKTCQQLKTARRLTQTSKGVVVTGLGKRAKPTFNTSQFFFLFKLKHQKILNCNYLLFNCIALLRHSEDLWFLKVRKQTSPVVLAPAAK